MRQRLGGEFSVEMVAVQLTETLLRSFYTTEEQIHELFAK
jgi:hypothetical protein